MGFLDSIKDRLGVGGGGDDYYDDDYYDEDGYDDEPPARGSGLLGNTPRPEAASISVYSHSTGRPVNGPAVAAASSTAPRNDSYDDGMYDGYQQQGGQANASSQAPAAYTPAPSAARMVSAQLPPYVIKPTAYDDVQSVIRRVRTDQPVVLAFQATRVETAKRILDFCFGLACGVDGSVEELGDSVFVVLPHGAEITEAEYDKLVADGVIARR